MTAEEQLQYLSSRQAALDAQDYLAQGLRLDARISLKLAQMDRMREQRNKLCQALGKAAEELPAEPALQLGDAPCVRPLLGAEHGWCAGRPGERRIDIVESLDYYTGWKGSEGFQQPCATVHDSRSTQTDPYLFDSLFHSILHQFTCTDG